MFKGLITPCKKCIQKECGLWVELTWKNEQTKKEEAKGECSIVGNYAFLARIENRMIATQKVAEESRNVSSMTAAKCDLVIKQNSANVSFLYNALPQVTKKTIEVSKNNLLE